MRGVGSLLRDTLGLLGCLPGDFRSLLCRPLRRVRSTFRYLTGCVRRLTYRVGSSFGSLPYRVGCSLCDLANLLGGLACGATQVVTV